MFVRSSTIILLIIGFCFTCISAAPAKKPPPPLKKITTLAPAQEDSLYETRGFMPLRGSQSGHFDQGTYVVASDITIAAGDTLEIKEGSTIMVKRMASITVAGMLVFSGNRFAPVTITSLVDTTLKEQNPDLARFKGISIQQNGRAHLRFMMLSGSQFGLVAEKGSTVLLDSAIFTNNLYADCRIGDSTYTSNNGKPISTSYNTTPALPTPNQAALVAAANVQPVVSVVSKPDDWKFPVRVSVGSAAVVGIGTAVYCALASEQSYKQYVNARDPATTTTAEVDRLEMQTKNYGTAAIISTVTAALCAAGFTVTFLIK